MHHAAQRPQRVMGKESWADLTEEEQNQRMNWQGPVMGRRAKREATRASRAQQPVLWPVPPWTQPALCMAPPPTQSHHLPWVRQAPQAPMRQSSESISWFCYRCGTPHSNPRKSNCRNCQAPRPPATIPKPVKDPSHRTEQQTARRKQNETDKDANANKVENSQAALRMPLQLRRFAQTLQIPDTQAAMDDDISSDDGDMSQAPKDEVTVHKEAPAQKKAAMTSHSAKQAAQALILLEGLPGMASAVDALKASLKEHSEPQTPAAMQPKGLNVAYQQALRFKLRCDARAKDADESVARLTADLEKAQAAAQQAAQEAQKAAELVTAAHRAVMPQTPEPPPRAPQADTVTAFTSLLGDQFRELPTEKRHAALAELMAAIAQKLETPPTTTPPTPVDTEVLSGGLAPGEVKPPEPGRGNRERSRSPKQQRDGPPGPRNGSED